MDNSFRFKKAELGVFSDNAKVPVNKLEKNGRVLGLTDGNFSLIDMIHSILKKVGKADVIVCTWSAGIKDAHQIRWMLDTNLIESFTIVTDHSYVTRQKKYALSLEQIFGKENSDFGLDRPKCLAIDSLDNIWIGGGPLNLQKFDGTEWKSFRDVLFPCNVSDLDFDKNNNLWVSSFSSGCGLFRFDGANWNNFNPDNSELTDGIIIVYEGDAVSVEEPENIFEDIKIEQNIPNPFDGTTEIKCIIPEKYGKNIKLVITDGTGLNVLKKYKLEPVIENNIKVSAIEFETGAYVYGISINGEIVKSKKMMIIK